MIAETLQGQRTTPTLHAGEFQQISDLAYRHFGLDLSKGKHELVEARIGKKLRELGLSSFQHYFDYVQSDRSGDALTNMVDVLTTNHTSFFRESQHFDFLCNKVYPQVRTRSEVHLWSAACSSGEEAYTIAMALLESAGSEVLSRVKIRATDISTRVLEKGRRAIYPADRCREIPAALQQRYMLRGSNSAVNHLRFKSEVRSMVHFEHLNLMQSLPAGYTCSVIFCRNIMIYFDKSTQQDLVQRLSQQLEPGGYLLIGHSESLNGIEHDLHYVCPATYRKHPIERSSTSGAQQ